MLLLLAANALWIALPLGILHKPRQVLETDHFRYLEMARHPVGRADDPVGREAPFCWRVLAPELARHLAAAGLGLHAAFYVLTTLSLLGFLVALFVHLRQLGFDLGASLTGMALAALTPDAARWYAYQYWMPDPLCLFLVTLSFVLIHAGRDPALLVVALLGVATRESYLIVLPYLFLHEWRRASVASAVRRTALIAVPSLLLLGLIRTVVQPAAAYDPGATLREMAAFRWRHLADNQPYLLTVGSLGVLIPLLGLFPGRLLAFVRRHPEELAVVAVAYASLLFANNTGRLLVYALPVVIPIALRNLRALQREAALPPRPLLGTALALQAVFLVLTPSHGVLGLSVYAPTQPAVVVLMALAWLLARILWRRRVA